MNASNATRFLTLMVLAALAGTCLLFAESGYRESVEKWRLDYQASLMSDNGWLTVSGLFWLKDGENRIGSGPGNDIVLPSSAPASVGVITLISGKTTMHVHPGVVVTVKETKVQTAELRPDSSEDRVVLGDLTFYVHATGNRLALRLRDKNSPLRKNFTGLKWFPIDESYVVAGKYIPYDSPREVDSENILGDAIKLKITGYVTFSLKGKEYRLDGGPASSGKFFIVFRDLTSGKETYPASRFLDVELPVDLARGGSVQIDFNKAYNPPCAYNPFTTCPLPLPGNRMKVEIPAGEKLYKRGHGA